MPHLDFKQAHTFVESALIRSGASATNAASVARALVAAEAEGLKGHGFSRVPTYAAQVKVGKIDGHAVPRVETPTASVALVDAAHGFAYPAIDLAVSSLKDMARTQGIAVAAIRRSHHCGAAGHPVEKLAEAGLVGLLFSNAPAAIAPWGGTTALFGTNPIAFACPLPDAAPIVVDLSLSKVARGNILAAKQKGMAIPSDWALDAEGKPTTDPSAALAGTMLPIGDHKGTILALMVELLAAGLTNATYAHQASSFLDAKGPPPATGQLLIGLSPEILGGKGVLQHFSELARAVEAQAGSRLPGTRRLAARQTAAADGLQIADSLHAEIAAL